MMMPQPQSGDRRPSTPESVSSFSSTSSSDDDQNYKAKYMSEKEKCRKLNEALSEIVVSNLTLKKEVKELKTQRASEATQSNYDSNQPNSTTPQQQRSEEVFTELEYARESIPGSKKTSSNSSASFVVIDPKTSPSRTPSFVVIDRNDDEEVSRFNSGEAPPVSEQFLTALGFEEIQRAEIGVEKSLTDQPTQNKDTSSPQPTEICEHTEASPSVSSHHSGQHSDKDSPHILSQQAQSVSSQSTDKTAAPKDSPLSQTGDSIAPKTEDNLVSQSALDSVPSKRHESSNPQSLDQSVPGQPISSSHSSHESQAQLKGTGPVSITAWSGPKSVKPAWQMEQDLTRRSSKLSFNPAVSQPGMNDLSSPSLEKHLEPQNTFAGQQKLTMANRSLAQTVVTFTTLPNDISKPNVQLAPFTTNTTSPMETTAPLTPTWGVGAKPKSSNTLREVNPLPPIPLIPHTPWTPNVDPGKTSELVAVPVQSENDRDSILDLFTAGPVSPPAHPHPSSAMMSSTRNGEIWRNHPSRPLVSLGSGDLMTFPSLKGSPSPEDKQKAVTPPPDAKTDQQRVAVPSEEESQLVSQAHSMMAALENSSQSNQSGISDMLHKFAQSANQMENKLLEYQALIQRQQVQIQSLSQHNNAKELEQLRKENQELLTYINDTRNKRPEHEIIEPASVTHEKLLTSDEPSRADCAEKRVQVLEGLNAKLFQANKEWAVRWEVFRQQRKDEKKEFDLQLQTYVSEAEKLRRDYLTMEKQLTDAVVARQEANQKNLELEQAKLNMLKKMESLKAQTETLSQQKRQLEAEMVPLKTEKLKVQVPEDRGQSKVELKAEIALLKQQLSVFHEDFQKEREDRQKAETRSEKNRKQQETMKAEHLAKTKKWQAMMKTKDDDIKQKTRKLAELQYQVDHLKIQLQRERKLLAIHTQGAPPTSVPPQTSSIYPITPISALPPPPHPRPLSANRSPEHQPGSWECRMCTFVNFPEKKACEICEWQYEPGAAKGAELPSGRSELHSRGDLYSIVTDAPKMGAFANLEVDGPVK